MSENKNIGWICPKCGQVNAPFEKTCSCSSKNSTQPDKTLDDTGCPSNFKTLYDSIPGPGYQFIGCPKCGGNIEIPELLPFACIDSIIFTCKNCGHTITIQDSNVFYNYILTDKTTNFL